MNVIVRWNNSLSDVLRVRRGVRQGGVLSPYPFNVYADVFINNIVTRGRGCHIRQTCEGSGEFSFGVSLAEIMAGPAAPAP